MQINKYYVTFCVWCIMAFFRNKRKCRNKYDDRNMRT